MGRLPEPPWPGKTMLGSSVKSALYVVAVNFAMLAIVWAVVSVAIMRIVTPKDLGDLMIAVRGVAAVGFIMGAFWGAMFHEDKESPGDQPG